MTTNTARVGNFTSSEIVALIKSGKACATYIQEKNFERRLGRSLSDECDARPLTWGKLLEGFVFEQKLSTAYSLNSTDTLIHPEHDCWAGSPDGFKYDAGKTVCDIKAPYTLKSFCQLVDPLYNGLEGMDAMNAVRATHKDGEKYYWQLVSNACIADCKYAELIIYMPSESDLEAIKSLADDGQGKHYFIAMAEPNSLPFLPDGCFYRSLNIIRFEVPQADKDLSTARVEECSKQLIKPSVLLVAQDAGAVIISQA